MTIHSKGNVAVVRTGDVTTVMLQMETDVALDFRDLVSGLILRGVGDISPESRQLLFDLDATLRGAFRVKRRLWSNDSPTTKLEVIRPPAVCQIPVCGCDGTAHP